MAVRLRRRAAGSIPSQARQKPVPAFCGFFQSSNNLAVAEWRLAPVSRCRLRPTPAGASHGHRHFGPAVTSSGQRICVRHT